MAVIIGESGAWKQVRQLAWRAGIIVEQPADIPLQLAKARQTLAQEDTLARNDLAVQRTVLERKLADERAAAERDSALIRARADEDLATLARRPWTAIVRSTRQAQTQRQIRRRLQPVLLAERALEDFTTHEETEVARRVEAARKVTLGIEAVADSQELAGAVAELDVIRALGALPDSYTLLNDVSIAAKHPVPYEGDTIVTAQLDHLLVGPTGVYVIETRNWSKAFLMSGDHADPVQQVKRSSALCRSILREAGLNQSVSAILACAGAMPDSPAGEHVAVMPITRLAAYVQHAAQRLSPDEAERVLHALAVPVQTR